MRNSVLHIALILCLFLKTVATFGQQVVVGNKQQFSSSSSILEFPENDTRGLVLPKVNVGLVTKVEEGMLVYDVIEKKIKYSKGIGIWEDLSINIGEVDPDELPTLIEDTSARTLIGNNVNVSTEGVLVLDSTSRALVLPRVENPHLRMISPPTGTIVYDTKTNMLCVYNGKEWAFWAVE